MRVVMKGAGFFSLLAVALGAAAPGFAQAPETPPGASQQPGSVIVFPKFTKGMSAADGVTPLTEIEVSARCPSDKVCTENEPVKVRFHWVGPGSDYIASKYTCKESGFYITLSANGKVVFNPENLTPAGANL